MMQSFVRKGQSLIGTHRKRVEYRAQEFASYLDKFLKPIPSGQVRVLIFGQGRTGSTLLESLLASTGHFQRSGELLNVSKGEIFFPDAYVRGMSKKKSDANFLFHLKIYHLTRDRRRPVDPSRFLTSLDKDGWKVLYLRRRNTVRHQLSNAVRETRGRPHKFDDEHERYRILIDCESFVEKVSERLSFEQAERIALEDIDFCEVVYEDDLENASMHQSTIDRILDFVSLERRPVTTNHRKVNTQDLNDLIINYDEFVQCLVKSDLDRFL
jgi:LPS sulfotransferase NodH